MVGTAVALEHLARPPPNRERQHLVPQADPEQWLLRLQHPPDHRHRIFSRSRRVARPVRQEEAVRLMPHDLVKRRGCRHNGYPSSSLNKVAKDVAFVAIIDCNDMRSVRIVAAELIALPPGPLPASPALDLKPADFLGEVHALQAGPLRRHLLQLLDIELAVGAMRKSDIRRP